MIGWFRIPPWCLSVHDEEAAPRARAWIYLLGAWDAGDDPRAEATAAIRTLYALRGVDVPLAPWENR